MNEAGHACRQVRVHGRVQGVFYRAWTQRTAQSLGLAGWVRNRRDGTVEALLCGPRTAVEEMLKRMHDGPPAAQVDRVDAVQCANHGDECSSDIFEILPTF